MGGAVVLRRLLSLDYVLEHPHGAWLPTEDEKVNALTAAGISKQVLPHRLYQGAVGTQYRYFPHKLPAALDGGRATFLYVQTDEDETVSTVRTWGSQHSAPWAALAAAGRAVEVVVVGRDPVRLAAERVLDQWAATPPESVTLSQQEAETELAAIKKAIAAGDWAALEVYGGLNLTIKHTCVLDAACAGSRRSKAAITTSRTWRSTRVPEWIPAGRGVGEAA